jgi:hypothetical protein
MVRSRKLAFSLTPDRSRCVPPLVTISSLVSHPTIQTFFFSLSFLAFSPFFPFGPATMLNSCIAHFSTRRTVAHRPVNAAALVPPGAYRSLSLRFRRHQIMARMASAYGTWTSCRFASWEAGHRMGRTCESRVAIFDQARDMHE